MNPAAANPLEGVLYLFADGVVQACPGCCIQTPGGGGGQGEHWAACANKYLSGTLYLFVTVAYSDCGGVCPDPRFVAGSNTPLEMIYSPSLGTWTTGLVTTAGPDPAHPCNNATMATFELTDCTGSLDSLLWPSGCQCGILARCYAPDGTPNGTSQECLLFNCHNNSIAGSEYDSCFADPSAPCYDPTFSNLIFVMRDHQGGMCGLCRYSLTLSTKPSLH